MPMVLADTDPFTSIVVSVVSGLIVAVIVGGFKLIERRATSTAPIPPGMPPATGPGAYSPSTPIYPPPQPYHATPPYAQPQSPYPYAAQPHPYAQPQPYSGAPGMPYGEPVYAAGWAVPFYPQAQTNLAGPVISLLGGFVALISLFTLPAITINLTGSFAGTGAASFSFDSLPAPSPVFWLLLLIAGISSVIIAGSQMLFIRRTRRSGSVVLLVADVAALLFLFYLIFYLTTSSDWAMAGVAESVGLGTWVTAIGLSASTAGSIIQLSARR